MTTIIASSRIATKNLTGLISEPSWHNKNDRASYSLRTQHNFLLRCPEHHATLSSLQALPRQKKQRTQDSRNHLLGLVFPRRENYLWKMKTLYIRATLKAAFDDHIAAPIRSPPLSISHQLFSHFHRRLADMRLLGHRLW